MGVRIVTQPAVEPVTLTEVKQDLRIDHTDDDIKLARFISAARWWAERRIQGKIALQELEFAFDGFPTAEVKLPVGPVASIVGVFYDDEAGLEVEMPGGDYWLDNTSDDAWLFPETGWPSTLVAVNSVRIHYMAGYAVLADVPAHLKQAIRLKVQELYDGGDYTRAIEDLILNEMRLVA